jgi:hypothetical protein
VLPVSVAKHLLEASSTLWRRVAILGDGPCAADVVALIATGGGDVIAIDGPHAGGARQDRRGVSVVGRGHVSGLRIHRDGRDDVVACDAVLLAADPRPVRNVDGAIADDADAVVYLQDVPGATFDDTARRAQALAREIVIADRAEEAS